MHRHESTWALGSQALFLVTFATLFAGCQGEESAVANELSANTPTWEEDIAPLVREKCVSCHYRGGNTSFSMENYASVKSYAGLMAYAVDRGGNQRVSATLGLAKRHPIIGRSKGHAQSMGRRRRARGQADRRAQCARCRGAGT